jgi:uncharacterized protein (DUF433 family)
MKVNRMKALSGEKAKHVELNDFIVADPDILGGDPVFRGTRVPVATLFEHLERDYALEEFLENFPSVSRETAVAVITASQELGFEDKNKKIKSKPNEPSTAELAS